MIPAINEVILAMSSSLVASIVVKATAFIALGLTGASLARRSRASVRHALLAAAFGMLLVLPVASFVVPAVRIELPAAAKQRAVRAVPEIAIAIPTTGYASVAAPAPRSGPSITALLLTAWIAGMVLFLSPVLLGLWQVRSLRRSALPWAHGQAAANRLALDVGIHRRVTVLLHEDLPGPMTCGALHPAIVLPLEAEGWDAEALNRAIVHELEHVRRGDWVSQCLARAVCAIYWFHPLVWMAWRRLTLEAERSCDDAVLGRSDAAAYADQLVGLAQRLSSARRSPLLAMVSRSDLAARVGAVLDSRQRRGRAGTLPVALACAAAAALVLTLSPFRMVAAPPSETVVADAAPVAAPAPAEPAPPNAAPAAAAVPAPKPSSEAAPPQNPSRPAQPAPVVQFMSRSGLVAVNVTVTDLNGQSIDGLGARDFVLLEDGVAQGISTFEFHKVDSSADGTQNAPSSYYVLGYYSTNPKQDGQYRKIQVIDKNDSTATVKNRSGYYANKPVVNPNPVPAGAAATLPPGTTPPVLIFRREAEYSEEARKAKFQGSVLLSVVVTDEGKVSAVRVVRSLGLGLDEKAIEAVQQWKFKPATTNGTPVTMETQVTVDFRLL
jgi:TonB family protein